MLTWVLGREEEDLGAQVAQVDLEVAEMVVDPGDQEALADLVALEDLEDPADKGELGEGQGSLTHSTPTSYKCPENFLEIVRPTPLSGCTAWHVGASAPECLNMTMFGS